MNIRNIVLALVLIFSSCTENERARSFGGSQVINLPPGKKFVNATWKEADLWYIVRDRNKDEKPETYEFIEQSNFGMMNGKIIFKEN